MQRSVIKTISGTEATEGAGVRIRRYIGTPDFPDLDPILLLDEFRSEVAKDYLAGFPDHPHRGFETVTYMVAGRMRHHDNKGNSGLLGPGGMQWMTAGSGLVHSEMPEQEKGLLWGYQIWLNLGAKEKSLEPVYVDTEASLLPRVELDDESVAIVMAGTFKGLTGPAPARATEPLLLDIHFPADASTRIVVPSTHAVVCFIYRGEVLVGGKLLGSSQMGVLGDGDSVIATTADRASRMLLLAAKPLGEPVARYGPFVMNTQEEVHQAFEDYREGRM